MKQQTIREGAVLTTRSGEKVTIGKLIAAGGQGEVYRGVFRGREVAVKVWFSTGTTPEQREQVEKNVHKGPPSSAFVWPLAVLTGNSGNPIGYVMELIAGDYVTLEERLAGLTVLTFYPLVTSCIELTRAMKALHQSHGMCFVDLNTNNLLINPRSGGIRIIDTDNCAPQSVTVGVLFSFGAAAPEVVRREVRPSLITDLHSLAATIFMLIVGGVPFEGQRLVKARCLNMETMSELHGTNPLFVFHPQDQSNAPDERQQAALIANWKLLPRWMRQLFIRVFTEGLTDPAARLREAQWTDALVKLRDAICVCRQCGAHVFLEESLQSVCWHCRSEVLPRRVLKTDQSTVVLNVGSQLFPHHIDRKSRGDLRKPLGLVVVSKKDERVLGLQNTGKTPWRVITPQGDEKPVESGGVSALARGNQIFFGDNKSVAQIE